MLQKCRVRPSSWTRQILELPGIKQRDGRTHISRGRRSQPNLREAIGSARCFCGICPRACNYADSYARGYILTPSGACKKLGHQRKGLFTGFWQKSGDRISWEDGRGICQILAAKCLVGDFVMDFRQSRKSRNLLGGAFQLQGRDRPSGIFRTDFCSPSGDLG